MPFNPLRMPTIKAPKLHCLRLLARAHHVAGARLKVEKRLVETVDRNGEAIYPPAWRIIPFSRWLITMVSKSPNWGGSPYKWPINGGY